MARREYDLTSLQNRRDMAHFIALTEDRTSETSPQSRARWDRRAEDWERKRLREPGDNWRVEQAVAFLQNRGLLEPGMDVADIGCGPGRFAAAFAPFVRQVTGFDLSERMVAYGVDQARREGVDNVFFRVCDFQSLDVAGEGLAGAFDLVFSSLTPAVRSLEGLEKMMTMSRAYCCHITHLSGEEPLLRRAMEEALGRSPQPRWNGRWFYALFNLLFLLGYDPEVSYDRRVRERRLPASRDQAALLLEQLLPPAERGKKETEALYRWLQENAEEDGTVLQHSETCYGRVVWDVRLRTERPGYGAGAWEE